MNTINLTGNICIDVELKQTPTGKSVVQFNLAVKRPNTKDATDFIPIVAWEQKAEFLSMYARKGSKIAVSGKLASRKYQDKNGNNRTVFEVIADNVELLDKKSEQPSGAYVPDAYTTPQFEEVSDDEGLPF